MNRGLRIAGVAAGTIVAGGVVGLGAGAVLWERATQRTRRRLLDRAAEAGGADTPVIGPVPAPVKRFLERSLPAPRRTIRVARLRQVGEFLVRPPDRWAPFYATEFFLDDPPGLLWDARIRVAPLLDIRVRDRYDDGRAAMHGALGGLVTVVSAAGTRALAEATLLRYLAEAPWFPSRLRPSEHLRWEALDDHTALATLRDGDLAVSLRFHFDDAGDIRGTFAERRFRGGQDGGPEWAPWIGRFSHHARVHGFRIPTRAEVAWEIDGEEKPYWRGTITSVAYTYR